MCTHNFQPGDVVVSNFAGYQHWSIVSDRKCNKNNYMLISANRRSGTVSEESFEVVTQNSQTFKVSGFEGIKNNSLIGRARACVGKWKYSFIKANCEHFVFFILTGNANSEQVNNGLAGGFGALLGVAITSKKLHVSQLILILGLAGYISVFATRAKECPFSSSTHTEIMG